MTAVLDRKEESDVARPASAKNLVLIDSVDSSWPLAVASKGRKQSSSPCSPPWLARS